MQIRCEITNKLLTNSIRTTSMDQCSTIAFKAGDVVQTQVSFIAFQKGRAIKGKKTFGVHTVLRSVCTPGLVCSSGKFNVAEIE